MVQNLLSWPWFMTYFIAPFLAGVNAAEIRVAKLNPLYAESILENLVSNLKRIDQKFESSMKISEANSLLSNSITDVALSSLLLNSDRFSLIEYEKFIHNADVVTVDYIPTTSSIEELGDQYFNTNQEQ